MSIRAQVDGLPASREQLAFEVRSVAFEALIAMKVPRDRADDLAQEVTVAVLAAIESGLALRGDGTGYVKVCARRRAIDHFRANTRHGLVAVDDPEDERSGYDHERDRRFEAIWSAFPLLKDADRALLERLYLHDPPATIQELVEEAVDSDPTAPADPGARHAFYARVRARLDKQVQRARTRLQVLAIQQLETHR